MFYSNAENHSNHIRKGAMALKRNPKNLRRLKIFNNLRKVTNETKKNPDKSEVASKKEIKNGAGSEVIWGIFAEYCDSSTIHGIKYLGEQKRSLPERLFWISVFILSIFSCAFLSINAWNKWRNNTVIVSFAEKPTPVWEIPFPAVTVCSEIKYNKHFFNFREIGRKIRNHKNLTNYESLKFDAVRQTCKRYDIEDDVATENLYVDPKIMLRTAGYPPCETIKWGLENQTDCDILRKVMTEEGLCYSFNNFDEKEIYREGTEINHFYFRNIKDEIVGEYPFNDTIEWNLQDGYSPAAGSNTFPRRVLRDRVTDRLFLKLSTMFQRRMRCGDRVPGFKVVLHTPGEIARVTEHYIPIPFKQTVRISINPVIIKTSDDLKGYDPKRRLCYFQNERYLQYFKVYTQSNCRLECLSNYTLHRCGCVKFSMPSQFEANTLVCGGANFRCMNLAESEHAAEEFNLTLNKPIEGVSNAKSCNCLPDCTSISYKADVSQANTEYNSIRKNRFEKSEVTIFFREEQFLTLQRSELYGMTDFLASCGGFLGLFMGVSTLSIAELVYFCCVRLVTNLIMRRKKRLEMDRQRHEEVDVALEAIGT